MAANYNNSAWFYDALARLVYGKALVNAQVYLLQHIRPGDKVLIVGGGTGWILEELTKIHPASLNITYVEVAPNMMARSKQRKIGQNEVVFITNPIENEQFSTIFDVVLTPFLLDNFTEANLDKVFSAISQWLRPGGLWLNNSFQLTGKWWQSSLLKTMFIFFKLICGIEASKLPAIDDCFTRHSYNLLEEKQFFGGFIGAKVYQK